MIEASCFLDKDKNIFAFKGEISKEEVNEVGGDLPTENYKHQKKKNCNSKQPACLDLHDCNLKTAEEKLQKFILFCKQRSIKKIKIITGKGVHSGRNFYYLEYNSTTNCSFKKAGISSLSGRRPITISEDSFLELIQLGTSLH